MISKIFYKIIEEYCLSHGAMLGWEVLKKDMDPRLPPVHIMVFLNFYIFESSSFYNVQEPPIVTPTKFGFYLCVSNFSKQSI